MSKSSFTNFLGISAALGVGMLPMFRAPRKPWRPQQHTANAKKRAKRAKKAEEGRDGTV